jgi:serine/threonine-protein kinase
MIDRCYYHGLWLDRGELGRLMGGSLADDRGDDDLAALRERLKIVDTELEKLLQRRDAWRAEAAMREQSAAEYRKWLVDEQQRRAQADRAARSRARPSEPDDAEERERREAAAVAEQARVAAREREAAEQRRLGALAAQRAEQARRDAERRDDERARQAERLRNAERIERERALQKFGDQRANASSRVDRIEEELRQLREQIAEREHELQRERTRLSEAEFALQRLARETK